MRRAIFNAVITAAALSLAGAASAQKGATHVKKPNYDDIYCSGVISTSNVPYDTYLISGEESSPQATFSEGQYVYINRGSSGGVKIGDEFLVSRPVSDPLKMKWFDAQPGLLRAMGTRWQDVGRLKVVALHPDLPNVATAIVTHSCDYLLRGDYVRPFEERPQPTIVIPPFNRFAPPNGKSLATVVSGKDFHSTQGTNEIVYVNLGSAQGVNIGDYFRIFRLQGMRRETAYQLRNMQYKVWGYGAAPDAYSPQDLPREALGEGIVVRIGENAATVLITYSLREVYAGDYVEHEGPREVPAPPPPPPPPAKPANQPPALTCSAERGQAIAGERVRISCQASDPDGDVVRFTWKASGGQVIGTGAVVVFDTTGLEAGDYTVAAHAEDPSGAGADATVPIEVTAAAAPAQPTKTHEGFFRTQSAVVDNVFKRILDDVALRLNNEPGGRVLLIGFADERETDAEQLANQRAANAKAYLTAKGVAADRIDTQVQPSQPGAGRQNQRVDVIWIPAGVSN